MLQMPNRRSSQRRLALVVSFRFVDPAWLRWNAECLLRGEPDDWNALGIALTNSE